MIQDVLTDAEQRMEKALNALGHNLSTVRTGRANPSLLDRVQVDYYGSPTPINQVASINVPEPRMLVIAPWEPSTIPAIEKAILKSDLGVNPSSDGKVVRIALPPLTEERRRQLVKVVHSHIEESKVAIRNIRRDAVSDIKDLQKEKLISENDERTGESKVDELTKKFADEADKIGKAKEIEVMEV